MRLTVVQILPELETGGVERGTLEIAAELVKRGHRSIVVSSGGRLVDLLINNGSEHTTIPVGKKSPLTLRYISKLREFFEKENVDIIHARSRFPAWISYMALKSLPSDKRPRFITTVHGPYSVNAYSKIMTRGERVIAVSEYIRQYILDNFPDTDEKKIIVIHRGVASCLFPYGFRPAQDWVKTWQAQHPGLSGKFIITFPARITRWKGHEDFLNIMNELKINKIPVHGLVVGGPHPRRQVFYDHLINTVNSMNLNNEITFIGHRNDVKEIMSISDVVLSLAKEPEAFGRTILESLCLGVPVIAYDHGGAKEILGEIFPEGKIQPNDTAAVCYLITKFYNSPPKVPDINPFTLESMLNKTMRLYEGF